MSYTNTYYPDYEKMYPGVKITPEVLAALRASDRQMRRFENELKTERFEADNEKQVARFIPSREDSYERLVEEDRLQFADEEMSVEDAVEYREMIRYLYQALAQLEVAEQLFSDLVEKIVVINNEKLCFRLLNGLEVTEKIERTRR